MNMQSSVEDLVSQQLQRNEMDGINQHRKSATVSHPVDVIIVALFDD